MPVSPYQRAQEGGLTGRSTSNKTSNNKGLTAPKNGGWIETFLSAIMQGESVTGATNAAGVHITLPYKRRANDEAFRTAWQEAAEIGTELMEQEAARRAYHGTLKPVFHKGQQCGLIREYSDTLMIFLLKARRPDKYREGVEDGQRGSLILNVNIVNVESSDSVVPIPLAAVPQELQGAEVLGIEVVPSGDSIKQDN